MHIILEVLRDYGSQVSAIAVAIAFIVSIWKYLSERRESHFWREFEVFHRLVKELVEPGNEGGMMYVDRQAAILFELRNFRRYYPYTLRMLHGLREKWSGSHEVFPRLLEELELTIKLLERRCPKRV
jgi:hypothetical protein